VLRVAASKGLTLFKSSIAASGYKQVYLDPGDGFYRVTCYCGDPPWRIPEEAAVYLAGTEHGRAAVAAAADAAAAALTAADAVTEAKAERLVLLPSKNRAGYEGVTPTPAGRFQAQTMVDGKNHYLGVYDTAEEAALVCARWRREHDADPVTLESAVKRLHLGVFEAVDEETRARLVARLVAFLSKPTFDGLMKAVHARASTEAKLQLVKDSLERLRGAPP